MYICFVTVLATPGFHNIVYNISSFFCNINPEISELSSSGIRPLIKSLQTAGKYHNIKAFKAGVVFSKIIFRAVVLFLTGAAAVSYTHLDVYKRQSLYGVIKYQGSLVLLIL